MALRTLAAALLMAPSAALALAEAPGPGAVQVIRAVRTSRPPAIDGRLDDAAWSQAVPFGDFVQLFPDEDRPPTQPTELRVLYDDRFLYVGVLARDARPREIVRPLGRRDRPAYSDSVTVIVDASHSHRRGQYFQLTAGGVQADGLYYDDERSTDEWDAVWDGRVALLPDGWSAEFAIPLSLLGVPHAGPQPWVFGVRREIARRHEIDQTVFVPRSARGVMSRLGHLGGMEDLRHRADLELLPFVAGRLEHVPAATRERIDPMLDLGLDLSWVIAPSLRLGAAVNPDYSQVESDQIFQNLTTYELYYAERRPFFAHAMDLFKPVTDGQRRIPQQLFYSRRIGLETPILAAAKLDGALGERFQFGLLDAYVTAPELPAGGVPVRDARFDWQRPFRLGPYDSLLVDVPAPANYLAGVAHWRATDLLRLGVTATSAIPTRDQGCQAGDVTGPGGAPLPPEALPVRCLARGGNAVAVDWTARSLDGEWLFYGQVDGSRLVKGPPAWLLADGTSLRPGDAGFGSYVGLARAGGEPWRFELFYEYESPKLDLNPSGYLRTQNQQGAQATLRYVRPTGGGPFATYDLFLRGEGYFTTDGRGLDRGNGVSLGGEAVFRNFWTAGCEATYRDDRNDVREIRYSGVPSVRPAQVLGVCWADTDRSKVVHASLVGYAARSLAWNPLPALWSVGGELRLVVRPAPAFETQLWVQLERNAYPGRYALADGGLFWFANLTSPLLSVVFRQSVVLTPRLSLQLFAQLFVDSGTFGPYWSASSPARSPIAPPDLVPGAPAFGPAGGPGLQSPDFHDTVLHINAVLRWEWRLGSTLYAVYQRSQSEVPGPGSPPASLAPGTLGTSYDLFLLKLSYWWNP